MMIPSTIEYMTRQFESDLPELEKELNSLGAEGWDLAHIERVGGQNYESGKVTPPIYQAILKKVTAESSPDGVIIEEAIARLAARIHENPTY